MESSKQVYVKVKEMSKLKGTYIDVLPAPVSPKTDHLHTTFNQIGAATGRLSSLNSNLQNIPAHTMSNEELVYEVGAFGMNEERQKELLRRLSEIKENK